MLRLLLAVAVTAVCTFAQTTGSATLVGSVTDATGAAIPGARVTVRSVERAFVYESETNTEGEYYVPNLTSGSYTLEVESDGFKKYSQSGIVLRTAEQPRINVSLEIGDVSESVTVESRAPLLETETASSGAVLEGDTVTKIPVLQKFVHRVLLYMPGLTNINGQHAVGQRQRQMGYTLDGVQAKEPVRGQVGDFRRTQIASLDAIQEFKMWTTGMPAEFGHSAGGLLSAVFRSGGNDYHGALDVRYTNGKMIHRRYFERLPRTGDFDYYEWGVNGGGPIVKNKTFWFFGFQQHYEELSETFIGEVPSNEMLRGNFDFGPDSFPIYDPATTALDADGNYTRERFANNQIPLARFDPVAQNLLDLQPWKDETEIGTLTPSGPIQNLVIPAFGGFNFKRFDWKIDHQFSAKHKIFGRYSWVNHRNRSRPRRPIRELRFQRTIVEPRDNQNIVISDSYTINPTTVNEFRAGFNRYHVVRAPETLNQDWAGQLGIPNVLPDTFPDFRTSSGGRYFDLGPGGGFEQVGEDFTFKDNLTKVVGRHTFKGGYEFIHTRYNATPEVLPSGQYRMTGTEFPFTPNTGNQFANLLVGGVGRVTFTNNTASWLPRFNSHAWYLQDSWKMRPDLSLELGLRWSYESPFKTKFGQQSQFDPNVVDPVSGMMGAITHPEGQLSKKDLNNFQPRLGMSWNFKDKWVFRGSFGAVTADLFTNGINQNFEEYLATTAVQNAPGNPTPAFFLSQGPGQVQFPIAPDGTVPFSGSNFSGRSASWYDPNMRAPYVMSWSAGLQYQMAPQWLVELQYQGSSGVGLQNNWDINQIPLDVSNNPDELNTIFRRSQDFKPYPQFGAIRHYSNYGHNSYHGGTLRAERRFGGGLLWNGFYTFSKAINEDDDDGGASGITFYDRRREKARANYDISHRFVSIFVSELPFGKGKKLLNGGGIGSAVLGGWEFAWTQTIQSGPPVSFSFGGSPSNYLPGGRRPNQLVPTEDVKVDNWDIGEERFVRFRQNRYFENVRDPATERVIDFPGFEYPAAFTAGTVGRNTVEAPPMFWMQLSLSRTFKITERFRAQIRWDLNNATKQAQFSNPNTQFNLANTANFGTFSGTRGSFSNIGTARMHHILVIRFEW